MKDNTELTEVDPATKQARDEKGKWQPGQSGNPSGAGGFADNPQNRSSGHWDKDESISYWYNKLLRMPDEEYAEWKPTNRSQRIAYERLEAAVGRDQDIALKATKEITDRTEGRPKQDIDMNIETDNAIPLIKGFVIPTLPEDFINDDIIAQGGAEHIK